MQGKMQSIAISLLVIATGAAWLMNTMDLLPGVNWVWVVGLAIAGLLMLALGGLNRLTIVVGPFLIAASVLSLMRQRGIIDIDQEVPILVITVGALLLIATLSNLPRAGESRA
jgi:hypothetical protein